MPDMKICSQCKINFPINPEDVEFYKTMGVATPEICPLCGIQRVMTWRNEHTLYKGKCQKCGKATLSMYHPSSPYVVWCHDCWWADDWDGADYAMTYEPTRPLLDQFYELQKKVPREAVVILNSTNCNFANHVRHSKDVYMTDLSSNSETVYYSEWILGKEIFDCKKITKSELLYECVDVLNCSRSSYLQDCQDSSECYFSYDLKGCTNCIFSSNLRGKSYYVRNQQVTREEFNRVKNEVFCGSRQSLKQAIQEYEMLSTNAIRKYSPIINSNECVGAFIENSNRLNFCFDAVECEDVHASASIGFSKRGAYSYSVGWPGVEFFFGSSVVRGGNNIKFSYNTVSCSDCTYGDSIISCDNCLASVALKHKEYSILNKRYSKEDYLKIKSQLEEKGELGIFPGMEFCTFAYNEGAAQTQYPLTRQEVLDRGWRWQDEVPPTTGQETIKANEIPDNIKDVDDTFLQKIYACEDCKRNFRIVQRELALYRQLNLPLPQRCPQCRMLRRRKMRVPYKLWQAPCRCTIARHPHAGGGCKNTFMTPYAPERPEKIYCEQCYNTEIA